jgi:hypothetical protein
MTLGARVPTTADSRPSMLKNDVQRSVFVDLDALSDD